jgi:hypothetical protein
MKRFGAAKSSVLADDIQVNRQRRISLHRHGDALKFRQNNTDPQGVSRISPGDVDGLFQENKPASLTVTL